MVATFIDYDLMIIPREITLIGLVFAIGMGTIYPGIRPLPAVAIDPSRGLRRGAGRVPGRCRLDAVRPIVRRVHLQARSDGLSATWTSWG